VVHPIVQCIVRGGDSGGGVAQMSIIRRFDGHGQRERGLWVECHTEEFCVKVLKFEIMNSRKSFNYFIGVVPRTIETAHPVTLFPGRFKNGPFKIREDDTLSLSQN
jgi:hypothetical protein